MSWTLLIQIIIILFVAYVLTAALIGVYSRALRGHYDDDDSVDGSHDDLP